MVYSFCQVHPRLFCANSYTCTPGSTFFVLPSNSNFVAFLEVTRTAEALKLNVHDHNEKTIAILLDNFRCLVISSERNREVGFAKSEVTV